MTVDDVGNSCTVTAANANKSNIYEISSGTSSILTASNIGTLGKEVITQGIEAISNYKLTNGYVGKFAGSPAYIANLAYASNGLTAQEDLVMHQTASGANYFLLVHLNAVGNADLTTLDNYWVWK
jgi:hypothetical protein